VDLGSFHLELQRPTDKGRKSRKIREKTPEVRFSKSVPDPRRKKEGEESQGRGKRSLEVKCVKHMVFHFWSEKASWRGGNMALVWGRRKGERLL